MTPPPPTKRARRALTQERAREIALAVSGPLRGRVRLVTAPRDFEIMGSYTWLELDVPTPATQPHWEPLRHVLRWVRQAREACAVWHLLASCLGLRGEENGAFWKRVIDQVANSPTQNDPALTFSSWRDHDHRDGAYVTDGFEFFPDDSFPRFQLHVPYADYFDPYREFDVQETDVDITTGGEWLAAVVRTFVGCGGDDEYEEIDDDDDGSTDTSVALRKYMPELAGHLDRQPYFTRPVDISVRLGDFYRLEGIAEWLTVIVDNLKDHARDTESRRARFSVRGQRGFPFVEFKQLELEDADAISETEALAHLTDVVETCNNLGIVIPLAELAPHRDHTSNQKLVRFVDVISQGWRSALQALKLNFDDASHHQIEILLSSLPATRLRSLHVATSLAESPTRACMYTWLAYHLYHPFIQRSALSNLDLHEMDFAEHDGAPLRSHLAAKVAMYRLLYDEEDDTAPEEDPSNPFVVYYPFVDVRAGTSIFLNPSLRGKKLCKLESSDRLAAVVKHATSTLKDAPRAIAVILPGQGYGWISNKHVTQLHHIIAMGMSIERLRLGSMPSGVSVMTALRPLVRYANYLDICDVSVGADEMLAMLRECGVLKELRICSNGDVFADWTQQTTHEDEDLAELRLDGLEIVCNGTPSTFRPPSDAAWATILWDLSAFSICTFGKRDLHAPAVRAAFASAHTVSHFVWAHQQPVIWTSLRPTEHTPAEPTRISYQEACASTRELLGIVTGKNDKAQRPLSERARLAFASVVKRKAQATDASHPMGKLSADVVQLVCAFATTNSERIVWVEDVTSTI